MPAFNRCSRRPRAPGVRAAYRAGVPATSSRPVSEARAANGGREGRRRGTSSEPLPVAARRPARPPARGEAAGSRVCGAASRAVGGSAFVRSCPERPPPRLERVRGGGKPQLGGPVLAPAAALQAGEVEGGTKGRWAFLLFV